MQPQTVWVLRIPFKFSTSSEKKWFCYQYYDQPLIFSYFRLQTLEKLLTYFHKLYLIQSISHNFVLKQSLQTMFLHQDRLGRPDIAVILRIELFLFKIQTKIQKTRRRDNFTWVTNWKLSTFMYEVLNSENELSLGINEYSSVST